MQPSYQDKHCITIEKIQHRFLRRVSFLTGNPVHYTDHSYDSLLDKLNVLTLENRESILT